MSKNIVDDKISFNNIANLEPAQKTESTLASNLQELLKLAHISEHELSRRTQVAQPIIHRLLSGNNLNPKLMTLKPIADYFMITVSQLIGEEKITSTWKGFTSKEHTGWIEIPLLNYAEALSAEQRLNKTVVMSEALVSDKAFALNVIDHTMEPLIPKLSTVIVEPEIEPSHGDCIALKINQEKIIIRNFFLIDKQKWISTINRNFGSLIKLPSNYEIKGTIIRTIYDPRILAKY